jgi:hypothetical protein
VCYTESIEEENTTGDPWSFSKHKMEDMFPRNNDEEREREREREREKGG